MIKTCDLNFPERIPVASIIYRVEYRKRIRDEDDDPCGGLCDPNKKILYLLTKYPTEAVARQAFWHERVHAINTEYGIEMSHEDLDRIAQGITQAEMATKSPTL